LTRHLSRTAGPRRFEVSAMTRSLTLLSLTLMLTLGLSPSRAAAAAAEEPRHPAAGAGANPAHDAAIASDTADAADSHPPAPAGTTADHGGGGGGGDHHEQRPLLDFRMGEAIWVIVIFLILLALLYPTAWKNVLAGLKAREQRIRSDIADAEAARGRAEQTLRDYNTRLAAAEQEVRAMLDRATKQGEQIATNLRAQAQQDAEATRERALRDIDEARKQAVSQIYEQAATMATSVAEKIIRRNLNPDDHRELVNQSLEQLKNVDGRNN
jgi:F-type H+-transporting ATPase subunit b